ncbi:hypothetical protein EVAR_44652_1 [Eumeta japonica]|uniref:Uncharacterized protein n=1 Tax=Eumeta variegata TaxID=151549 RepID=A0A4C1XIC3_EUMVA|nr:hypothetical protein EVAR_44652_1 [Eumeta japonica]
MDKRSIKCFLYDDDQIILTPSACGLQRCRMESECALLAIMNNKSVSRQACLAIHKWVLIPTPMKSSESWVWQKKNESRINVVEMQSLRSICEVSQKNRCKNAGVNERYGLKEDVVTRLEKAFSKTADAIFECCLGSDNPGSGEEWRAADFSMVTLHAGNIAERKPANIATVEVVKSRPLKHTFWKIARLTEKTNPEVEDCFLTQI